MKIMSPTKIATLHYIPSNHMFAAHMLGGVNGAKACAAKESTTIEQRFLRDGYDTAFVSAFVDWYLKSCAILIAAIQRGEGIGTKYPEFVAPSVSAKAANSG